MLSLRFPCLICALLFFAVMPAFATTVTYADQTAWLNASSGVSTIGFDGLATLGPFPLGQSTDYTTGLVMPDGTKFYETTNGSNQLYVYNEYPGPGEWYNYGSGAILAAPCCSGNPYITITLPQPVTSVGFNLMTSSSGFNFNIAVNNLTYIYSSATTPGWPNQVFWGITSDTPITSINLTLPSTANGIIGLDNFSYGSEVTSQDDGTGGSGDDGGGSDTPEACSMLLIGSGLVGLRLFRRHLWMAGPAC